MSEKQHKLTRAIIKNTRNDQDQYLLLSCSNDSYSKRYQIVHNRKLKKLK